jgi:hypothetical protein
MAIGWVRTHKGCVASTKGGGTRGQLLAFTKILRPGVRHELARTRREKHTVTATGILLPEGAPFFFKLEGESHRNHQCTNKTDFFTSRFFAIDPRVLGDFFIKNRQKIGRFFQRFFWKKSSEFSLTFSIITFIHLLINYKNDILPMS